MEKIPIYVRSSDTPKLEKHLADYLHYAPEWGPEVTFRTMLVPKKRYQEIVDNVMDADVIFVEDANHI
jgi:hypothetical protein